LLLGRTSGQGATAGRHVTAPHEPWITDDPFRGGVRVLITGPHGLDRAVPFAVDAEAGRHHRTGQSSPGRLTSVPLVLHGSEVNKPSGPRLGRE
jgi:hypothetical protein